MVKKDTSVLGRLMASEAWKQYVASVPPVPPVPPRPSVSRRLVYHITHIHNLPSIAENDLVCSSEVFRRKYPVRIIGNPGFKARRARTPVKIPDYGTLGDYVPWHFVQASGMLYKISKQKGPDGCRQSDIIYLVTCVDEIRKHKIPFGRFFLLLVMLVVKIACMRMISRS